MVKPPIHLIKQFILCKNILQSLLQQINKIEIDEQMSLDDKYAQIEIIRSEINKVALEIDNIKKEIMLINSYNVN